MTAPHDRSSLLSAAARGVEAVLAADGRCCTVEADGPLAGPLRDLAGRHPDRAFTVESDELGPLRRAAELAADGRTVIVSGAAADLLGPAYRRLRDGLGRAHLRVKILGWHEGVPVGAAEGPSPLVEDIGVARGIPGLTVAVPADGPSAEAAVRAVAATEGPAYLRLTRAPLPTVTHEPFRLGHAPVVRDGADLGVLAVGAMVARALELAAELAKVGVSARVLDLASVKPFDLGAVLRAARDTGALLVAEEHSVATGIGSLVAAATAENHPVPVRRVGLPDVLGTPTPNGETSVGLALSLGRMTEEAWELLRVRGKVE